MKFRNTIFGFLLLISWMPLSAQPYYSGAEEMYTFHITGWNIDIPDLFYRVNGDDVSAPAYRRTLGKLHELPMRNPELEFYVPQKGKEGLRNVPLLKVKLNPPPSNNLVVVWRTKDKKIESVVITDDPDSPPPGKVRFVNLTSLDLVLKCNHLDPFPLLPGNSEIIAPKSGGVGVGVKIAQKNEEDNAWELALMNGIPIQPRERVTAFIADPRNLALPPELEGKPKNKVTDKLTLFVIRDRKLME